MGMAAILFFLATWLVGAVVFVRAIFTDLDAILGLIFDGWPPAGVHLAASGLGMPASAVAWVWLGIELVLLVSFSAVGLVLFFKKHDGFGTYLGVAFVLIGTRISGPVTYSVAILLPPAEGLMVFLTGLSLIAFAILLYLFPNGRFVPRWSPWLLPVIFIWLVLNVMSDKRFMSFTTNNAVVLVGFFAIGLAAQIYRYWKVSTGVERLQTRGVLIAFVLFFLVSTSVYFVAPNVMEQSTPPTPRDLAGFFIFYVLLTGTTILFIVALTLAVLRYRLYDIDLIIRRTLSYAILTFLLGLVYFGSILTFQALFTALTGQNSPITIVISTLAIAALFNPLRLRVQNFIDRRFYRQSYDAQQALANFAATARDEVDMDKLIAELLIVVEETMQPEKTSLWFKPSQRDGVSSSGRSRVCEANPVKCPPR